MLLQIQFGSQFPEFRQIATFSMDDQMEPWRLSSDFAYCADEKIDTISSLQAPVNRPGISGDSIS